MTDDWTNAGAASEGAPGEDPLQVVTTFWEDLQGNPTGYLLSGLAVSVVIFAFFVVAMILVVLMAVPAAMFEDPNTQSLAAVVGGLVGVGLMTLGSVVVFPLLQASLVRGIAAQQDYGPEAFTFMSAFSTMTQDAVRVVSFMLITVVLTMIGYMLCFLPGLVVAAVSLLAFPIMVLEGVSPIDAYRRAGEHLVANPTWHVVVFLINAVILGVLSMTGIGGLFYMPIAAGYQVAAYREAFPDEGGLA